MREDLDLLFLAAVWFFDGAAVALTVTGLALGNKGVVLAATIVAGLTLLASAFGLRSAIRAKRARRRNSGRVRVITGDPEIELRAVTALHGTPYPSITDRELEHDERLAAADRRAEKAPVAHLALAYTERPSDRERREWFDETKARNALRPRTGNVTVQPRRVPCTCGAADRGLRLAGPAHRFSCPLHARRVDSETEAA